MSWTDGCTPTRYPGIYKTPTGYRIRVRAINPKTGTLKESNREFEDITQEQAVVKQAEMRDEIRGGGPGVERPRQRYADYATSLYERKIALGSLKSAKSRERWADTQDLHLVPAFGDWFVDAITKKDIEEWKAAQGRRIKRGDYSPNTVNGWLAILLTTLRSAVEDLELERDPTRNVELLDTSDWRTYTEEEPGALTVNEVPRFMEKARELYPQHFAMLALGLTTGRRPSELRPIRRKGPTPDVLWDEGVLLVRRSETKGQVVERLKQGKRGRIRWLRVPLPEDLMEILRWHAEHLPEGPMRESDLLFPSETGGYRAGSCLDKPIRGIAKAAGVTKHLSAKFMRRTFQDLGRVAQVHDLVVRAISGHATADMQQHYSTVDGAEVRAGLAKVISLAGFTKDRQTEGSNADGSLGGGPGGESGDRGGDRGNPSEGSGAEVGKKTA
jgi:integrase